MIKSAAIYGFVFVVMALSVFAYDHPHWPVVIDGPQTCQAYRLDVPGRTTLVTRPFYDGSWIVGQPVTCSSQMMNDVASLLRNPLIYGRQSPLLFAGHFDAQYAYLLRNKSGSVMVRIDTAPAWFVVDRFDAAGKHISSTGVVEEYRRWLALLRQTFPHDTMIARAWNGEGSR